MRWYLRAASLVLISLLSLSQAAIVYCEATCSPERARAAGMHGESACHSSQAADSGATRLEGVNTASCDHDLPSGAVVAAHQDILSLRPALQASNSQPTSQDDPQSLSHRPSGSRRELRVSGVIPLPLRI